MTGSPDGNVERVFTHAVSLRSGARAEYLRTACGDDASLRAEVESLLRADESATDFLSTPSPRPALAPAEAAPGPPMIGRALGPYRIVDVIARGGMGEVYLAERADAAFEMRVAIKVVRAGWNDAELARRFETERQVLASLEHPNISRLLDGGITEDGVPYLVMEYVEGIPIDRYCEERALGVDERLALMLPVLRAVQHAHQLLVVHRDLKPGNILVTPDGEPKLLDFGIAKVVDPTGASTDDVTATAARVLTPRYASPEQVLGAPVSVATDIYSIGVLVYELLTGRFPYPVETGSPQHVARLICECDPTRPSRAALDGLAGGRSPARLSRRLSGDLDTILLKALQKEPARRYASVAELSEDITRHLSGHPILSRPDTLRYRTTKFVRRHTRAVVATGIGLFALLVAAVVSTALYVRADRAQREATSQRATAVDVSAFLQEMLGSLDPAVVSGRDASVFRDMVDRAATRLVGERGLSGEVAAELHFTIGRCYRTLAAYDEAETHLELALRASDTPARREEGLEVLRELGNLHYDVGRYAIADSILSHVLARIRARRDPAPDRLAGVLDDLASVRERSGKGDAEALYRESVRVLRESHGDEHPSVAGALMNLGAYLTYHGGDSSDGRLDEAEQALERAREIFADAHGTSSAGYASTLHNLSVLKRRSGDPDTSEPLIRESLAIFERIHRPDHPEVLVSLSALASTLTDQGRHAEAESAFRRVIDGQRRNLGEDHVDVGTAWNNLAGVLSGNGHHEEARTAYERAAAIYRVALGDDHAWVAIVLLNLAILHDRRDSCGDVLDVLAACDRISAIYWPPGHHRHRVSESLRAACLAEAGEVERAEEMLLTAHRALEGELGRDNRYTRVATKNLIELYDASGRPELADPFRAGAP